MKNISQGESDKRMEIYARGVETELRLNYERGSSETRHHDYKHNSKMRMGNSRKHENKNKHETKKSF